MRTKSWASLLLLLPVIAAAQQSITLASGGTITASNSSARTVFKFRGPGSAKASVTVKRDGTVAAEAGPPNLKLIAEIAGSAILLTDTYPSRPGGLSYCQAGEEQFLRVFTISDKRPVETYQVKLASCWDNLELASPG